MSILETDICYRVTTVFAATDVGSYSVFPKEEKFFHSYWDTCREQLAKKFNSKSLGFFLSVEKSELTSVPKFIRFCEKILHQKSFTKFYLTDLENVIFVKPSNFWKKCYMRRSLFSLLCRIGIYSYMGDYYENYLFGQVDEVKKDKIDMAYKFARQTSHALTRFFGGYTCYVGEGPNFLEYFPEKHGWVEEFKNKPSDYIKAVLLADLDNKLVANFFDKSILLA